MDSSLGTKYSMKEELYRDFWGTMYVWNNKLLVMFQITGPNLVCLKYQATYDVLNHRTQPESNQHLFRGIRPPGSWWNKETVRNKIDKTICLHTRGNFLRLYFACFQQRHTCRLHSRRPNWRYSWTDCCPSPGHSSQITWSDGRSQNVCPTKLHIHFRVLQKCQK